MASHSEASPYNSLPIRFTSVYNAIGVCIHFVKGRTAKQNWAKFSPVFHACSFTSSNNQSGGNMSKSGVELNPSSLLKKVHAVNKL